MTDAARALRLAIRNGHHTGLTTGYAPGHVQANLVVLPQRYLDDFLAFCYLNAFACPVLGVATVGSPYIPALGMDLDVRTDLAGYQIHRFGSQGQEAANIVSVWRDDLVSVAIGCWFSMEDALLAAGVRLRHVELGIQGPLFTTAVQTCSKGIFGGPLVVSMRPFAKESVATVTKVTQRFPRVHGGPIHAGDPAVLGIGDISQPDFGELLMPLPSEVPMYWGCGLTATTALQRSGVNFFMTHAPGKMLVTDLLNASFETEPESNHA